MRFHLARDAFAVAFAFLLVTAAIGGVATVGAQSSDTTPELDASEAGTYGEALIQAAKDGGLTSEQGVVTGGIDGNPHFIIHYSENGSSALQEWANSSTDREILYQDEGSRWAEVRAPAESVGVSGWYRSVGHYLDTRLAHRSFVETVTVNRELSYSEPLSTSELAERSSYENPSGAWKTAGPLPGGFAQEGVAYRDVNQSTMSEVRDYSGVSSLSANGSGVTVGVVDTGLSYSESLYEDRVVAAKNTLSGEEANVTLDGDGTANVSQSDYSAVSDGNGHGSFVSSQIASNDTNSSYRGVAPGSQLIIAKSLDDEGSGSTSSIAQGIAYTCSQGADIVSLSLGGYVPQPTIAEEISRCYSEHNVSAVVVAVGNERQSARWVATPADLSSEIPVIGVAATEGAQPSDSRVAYFSNVGPDPAEGGAEPVISATGIRVQTRTEQGGAIAREELSGTSMATPVVSGVLAVALSSDSSLRDNPTDLRDRVEATASPIPAAGTSEVGSGMINGSQLVSGTEPDTSQESARTEPARARDAGNGAIGGSLLRGLLGGA